MKNLWRFKKSVQPDPAAVLLKGRTGLPAGARVGGNQLEQCLADGRVQGIVAGAAVPGAHLAAGKRLPDGMLAFSGGQVFAGLGVLEQQVHPDGGINHFSLGHGAGLGRGIDIKPRDGAGNKMLAQQDPQIGRASCRERV